ncbi:hypothetical protein ACIBIZ_03995 [Nonomuraea spiralis]|uniref:hypothetical protein n=1 Tax=Nonomuraea TaxID=83681 RepID=UPI000F7A0744|nr:hypothetical protein [Nonomuraea sp. WAC 01424]RSN14244.1 hypothetical protein DMB42_06805 [Nonomuraea sp. WAC 01424]
MERAAPGALRRTYGRLAEALLAKLDHWAFDALDERARSQGWRVRRPAPLVRVYRNPDFDLYVRCTACGGDGMTSRGDCRACRGFGRVRLS